ncbi:MAG: hypothetical protein OEW09_12240, partial [Anaerolineae bacterium]|nr:hypothetical protein [Anaerolineae bacterium]
GESADRVGAKRRIETKRLAEGALVGKKRLVSCGATVPRHASPLCSEATLRQAQDGAQPALTLQPVEDSCQAVVAFWTDVEQVQPSVDRVFTPQMGRALPSPSVAY